MGNNSPLLSTYSPFFSHSPTPVSYTHLKRGTTEMTSEIREKALFILDEIDRVIRQAEEQI